MSLAMGNPMDGLENQYGSVTPERMPKRNPSAQNQENKMSDEKEKALLAKAEALMLEAQKAWEDAKALEEDARDALDAWKAALKARKEREAEGKAESERRVAEEVIAEAVRITTMWLKWSSRSIRRTK